MDQVVIWYFWIGVVVAPLIYLVNVRIRQLIGPSIKDRLIEISLATCPLQGHWAMPLVTVVDYSLVAVGVVVGWPYALFVNIQRWLRYKPPMSDEEYNTELRELVLKIQNAVPMTVEKMEAERAELRKIVSAEK